MGSQKELSPGCPWPLLPECSHILAEPKSQVAHLNESQETLVLPVPTIWTWAESLCSGFFCTAETCGKIPAWCNSLPPPIPGGVGNRRNVQSQHVTEGQRAMRGGTSEGSALACSGPAREVDYEVMGQEGWSLDTGIRPPLWP